MEKGKKPVNKFLYCLLIILFGSLGIHKFYAQKYVSGALYIIFSWTGIPIILTIIDLFKALFKTKDSNGKIYV